MCLSVFVIKHTILCGIIAVILSSCFPDNKPIDPVAPDEPEVEFSLNTTLLTDNVVYPFPSREEIKYGFEIVSEKKLENIKVELTPDQCLDASYEMNPDGMSGTVSITTKDETEFNLANVNLAVSCGGKRQAKDMAVVLAYLRLSKTSGALESEGGELQFGIESNVDIESFQDEESKGFSSFTSENNIVSVKVNENQDLDERGGRITVKDKKGILSAEYSFTQAGSFGSRLTDSLALVKFYNDMEGWKWAERGSFEVLTKNWCTSEPLENWCGVQTNSHLDLTTYENPHDGRVTRIFMSIIYEDGSQHELSEAIGELKALTRVEIDGSGINGKLPRSLGSLQKLNYMWITSKLCDKLIDHPIKNIAEHLRFLGLSGDIWGPVPDWLIWARIADMNLSGRIPDKVCQQPDMQQILGWGEFYGWEDPTPMSLINESIIVKAEENGYAMWYGEEQPEGVEFVADEHEGHWRWLSTDYAWKFVKAHR